MRQRTEGRLQLRVAFGSDHAAIIAGTPCVITKGSPMSLRLLLTISGALEALVGVLALISPAPLVSLLLGAPTDSLVTVLARLFGAGVFALGLACLKARNDAGSPAGLAVSIGITSYNVLAAVVLIWAAAGLSLGGVLLWAAGIGHAVLGGLFVAALMGKRR